MKLLRANPDQLVFQVGKREQRMLFDVLQLYPLVPPAHHRLAPSGQTVDDEAQRLLDEALDGQRQENRAHIQAMLNDPGRFRETGHGLELTLAPTQIEWLLQVLNDLRVGCWLKLGEPEGGEMPQLDKSDASFWVAMEFCGLWESMLLAALGVHQSPKWH